MVWKSAIIVFAVLLFTGPARTEEDLSEEAGKKYLEKWDKELTKLTTESTLASWDYESNITDYNLERQLAAAAKLAKFVKEEWKQYPWQTYKDPDTRRQFRKYSYIGSAALPAEKYERLDKIVSEMEGTYAKAKVCDYRNASKCDLHLEPEITERFAESRDPEELKHLWTEWRKASGKPVRKLYTEYVALRNEAAKLNNFSDTSQEWLRDYESDDITDQIEALWQEVRPLYVQLHAYVRRRLREQYGEEIVSKTGPIPAHLLGNMWAQTWSNILNITIPYPNKPSPDVTNEMVAQNYTPLKMFKVAEEFFTSVGLSPMPDTFWKYSIIERPTDGRDLVCHASAWDFYDGKDFRIKQCTRVNLDELETVHHEMGHIEYFLQYKDQPIVYKEGANPGFHEAVGDVMALSVSTPGHLKKIGLLKNTVEDQESEINQLFGRALSKVAFLPFGYLMDQWRWGVFQGKITESKYNSKWWELREQFQGLQPPSQRTEEDFDPGAKYHTVGNIPYLRYFVSFIIQFQFHQSLCIAAGEFDPQNPNLKPLHRCDIYQNKKAGELLGKMLKMGSSKPWPDAMEVLTGQRKMDAGPLLQYFSILQTWLERENARTGEYIGWEPTSSSRKEERVHYYELEEPNDSSEDDNFEYSYAELVPQNANSFESTGYRVKLEPWLNPLLRRSTVNQFETNKEVNRVLKTDSRTVHEIGKSGGRSDRYRGGLNCARSSAAVQEPEMGPSEVGDESGRQQQSSLSKFLISLGASLPRPQHVASPERNAPSSDETVTPSVSSDLWNAEMIRMQAEEILKSYDLTDKPSDANVVATTDETNPAVFVEVTNSYPGVNPQESPKKHSRLWYSMSHHPQVETNPATKKTAKKSFMHYHYNVRTPVFYNTVVVKRPTVNTWMEDPPTSKVKLTYLTDQELPDGMQHGNNPHNNDRWKTIKLVPVDRNRMITFKQYLNEIAANVRKRQTRNGNSLFNLGKMVNTVAETGVYRSVFSTTLIPSDTER